MFRKNLASLAKVFMLLPFAACSKQSQQHLYVLAPNAFTYSPSNATVSRLAQIPTMQPQSAPVSDPTLFQYSISPALPAGLSIDPQSGIISGNSNLQQGAKTYTVSLSNASGQSQTTVQIAVHAIAPSGLSFSNPNLIYMVGDALSSVDVPTLTGGDEINPALYPSTDLISIQGLNGENFSNLTGLSIDTQDPLLAGTPPQNQGGTISGNVGNAPLSPTQFVLTATNSGGSTTANISVAINPALTLSLTSPSSTISVGDQLIFEAAGGVLNSGANYTFSLIQGQGSIQVSPSQPNQVIFTSNGIGPVQVQVSDSRASVQNHTVLGPIANVVQGITLSANPNYSQISAGDSLNLTASNGNLISGNYIFTVPQGSSALKTPVISGSNGSVATITGLAVSAISPVTVAVSDGGSGANHQTSYSFSVNPPLTLSAPSSATITQGDQLNFSASNGVLDGAAQYVFSINPANFGTSFSAQGANAVFIAPQVTTPTQVTVQVKDSRTGASHVSSQSFVVNPAPALTYAPNDPVISKNFVLTLSGTGGIPPYQFSVAQGSTAGTLVPNSNGTSATFTSGAVNASTAVKIQITDSDSLHSHLAFANFTVNPALQVTSNQSDSNMIKGESQTFSISGGVVNTGATYSSKLIQGSGTLTSSGTQGQTLQFIAGPTGAVQIQVTDSLGNTALSSFTVYAPGQILANPASIEVNQTSSISVQGGEPVFGLSNVTNLTPQLGQLSGSTFKASASGLAQLSGTDGGGRTITQTITIGSILSITPQTLLTQVGNPTTTFTANGGVGTYTFSSSDPTHNPIGATTGIFTPQTLTAPGTVTITVTDSANNSSQALVTVNDIAPTGLSYTPAAPIFTRGIAITSLSPQLTGGGAVVSYSVNPNLPIGLILNPNTGVISGTPSAITPSSIYTIQATNSGGSTNFKLNITVNDQPPTGLSYSTSPASYSLGVTIANNLPQFSGGGAPVSFSVTPALPSGLNINSTTGIISGTPLAAAATSIYTITAQNTGGSASFGLSITVINLPPSGLTYSTNPAIYTRGIAITANNPHLSGGGAPSAYSVSPVLPAGLALNTSSGVITGTPTRVVGTANYIVTASNAGGSTTAQLTITVNDQPPSGLTYTVPSPIYTKGIAIANNSPTLSGGGAVTSYTVTPALPSGLSLSLMTGVISGTPGVVVTPAANYTITASNTGGSTTFVMNIMVMDQAPSSLAYSVNPATYTKGLAITGNSPSNSGGTIISYNVSPALPAGLALNPSTGVISGTPTAITTQTNYVVTGTNTGGSTSATLAITVNDQAPTSLTYSQNPAIYTKNTALSGNSPSNSGGTILSYAVSPTLPPGLVLNPSTGVIAGTPTAIAAQTNYVVTGTNTGGSTSATLVITVNDQPPTGLSYSPNTLSLDIGIAMTPDSPHLTGGGAVTSYSISPAAPAGLLLNTKTGILSGTPTTAQTQTAYTIKASNTGGSATAALLITIVNPTPVITIGAQSVPYFHGEAINPLYNSVSVPISSCVSTPALPTGLIIDQSTCSISGQPAAKAAYTTYNLVATGTTGVKSAATPVSFAIYPQGLDPSFNAGGANGAGITILPQGSLMPDGANQNSGPSWYTALTEGNVMPLNNGDIAWINNSSTYTTYHFAFSEINTAGKMVFNNQTITFPQPISGTVVDSCQSFGKTSNNVSIYSAVGSHSMMNRGQFYVIYDHCVNGGTHYTMLAKINQWGTLDPNFNGGAGILNLTQAYGITGGVPAVVGVFPGTGGGSEDAVYVYGNITSNISNNFINNPNTQRIIKLNFDGTLPLVDPFQLGNLNIDLSASSTTAVNIFPIGNNIMISYSLNYGGSVVSGVEEFDQVGKTGSYGQAIIRQMTWPSGTTATQVAAPYSDSTSLQGAVSAEKFMASLNPIAINEYPAGQSLNPKYSLYQQGEPLGIWYEGNPNADFKLSLLQSYTQNYSPISLLQRNRDGIGDPTITLDQTGLNLPMGTLDLNALAGTTGVQFFKIVHQNGINLLTAIAPTAYAFGYTPSGQLVILAIHTPN